jgi:hypothetical protein
MEHNHDKHLECHSCECTLTIKDEFDEIDVNDIKFCPFCGDDNIIIE